MKRENEAVPAMKLMKLRIATGLGLLLSAVMLCATPVFAQELRHVAEVLKRDINGPRSFGPAGANCDAALGGLGCKFVTLVEGGTGKIVEGGDDTGSRFTFTHEDTALFAPSTPSGAHNLSGDPTGFCVPLFGQEHWVFEDGSTIDLNRQGTQCCAASSCSGGSRVTSPLTVTHVSTIITGGTGRFVGLKGGGERATSGPGAVIEEQVWELPSVPEN
jgi:hypothetical protein